MKLKAKISWGLGFLFLIIFSLAFFCMYYIGKLANDSENILKDNYLSIGYAKNMHFALDKMKDDMASYLFGSQNMNDNLVKMKKDFENNLKAEQNNITEIHEKEHVESLVKYYAIFIDNCKQVMSRTKQ